MAGDETYDDGILIHMFNANSIHDVVYCVVYRYTRTQPLKSDKVFGESA